MEAQQISKEKVLALLMQGSTTLNNKIRAQCMQNLKQYNTINPIELLRVLIDLLLHQSVQTHLIAFGYILRVWIGSNRVRAIQPEFRKAYILLSRNANLQANRQLYGGNIIKLVGEYYGAPVCRKWLQQMIKEIPLHLPKQEDQRDFILTRYFCAVLQTIHQSRYPPLVIIRADLLEKVCYIALNRLSDCQLEFFIVYARFIALLPAQVKALIIYEIGKAGRVGLLAVKTTLKFIQSSSILVGTNARNKGTFPALYVLVVFNAIKKLKLYLEVERKLNEQDQQEMQSSLKLIQSSLIPAVQQMQAKTLTQDLMENQNPPQLNPDQDMEELSNCIIEVLSAISLKVSSPLYSPSPSLLTAMVSVVQSMISAYKSISKKDDLLKLIQAIAIKSDIHSNVGLMWLMCGFNRQMLSHVKIEQIIGRIINNPIQPNESTVHLHLIKHFLTVYYYIQSPLLPRIVIYLHSQIGFLSANVSLPGVYRIALVLSIFPKFRKFSFLFDMKEMAGIIGFIVKGILQLLMMDNGNAVDSQTIALLQSSLRELINPDQTSKAIHMHCTQEVFTHISHVIVNFKPPPKQFQQTKIKKNNTSQLYSYSVDLLLSILSSTQLIEYAVMNIQSLKILLQVVKCIYNVKGYEQRLYEVIKLVVTHIQSGRVGADQRWEVFVHGLPKDMPQILLPILADLFQDAMNKYEYNSDGVLVKSKNHKNQIKQLIYTMSYIIESLAAQAMWKPILIIVDYFRELSKNIDINGTTPDQVITHSFKSAIRDALLNLEVNNLSIQ